MPKATVTDPAPKGGKQPAPRPVSVKVLFQTYAVIWMRDDIWRGCDLTSNDNIGEHNPVLGTMRIRLVPGATENYLRETLLHEILHSCWAMSDLNEKPLPADEDQEENIIARVSHLLATIILDNPDVFAYIGAQLYKKKAPQ